MNGYHETETMDVITEIPLGWKNGPLTAAMLHSLFGKYFVEGWRVDLITVTDPSRCQSVNRELATYTQNVTLRRPV